MAQKTRAQLQTANAAIFGAGKDTLGDDEKAYNLDLNDSVAFLSDMPTGSWTPGATPDGSVVTSASVELAWYTRVGDIVTGFIRYSLEADFSAGNQGSIIFTPPIATTNNASCMGGGNNTVNETLINCDVSGGDDFVVTVNSPSAGGPSTPIINIWFAYQVVSA